MLPGTRRPLAALLLLLPFGIATQCEPPDHVGPLVRVLSPAKGELRTCMPQEIDVDFSEFGDGQTLRVWLNGQEISGEFSLGTPAGLRVPASASRVWAEGLIGIGTNLLEATVAFPGGVTGVRQRWFEVAGDPYADAVVSYAIGTQGGFNESQLPGVVVGRPFGAGLYNGSLDVFSLGLGGVIDLAFTDNLITDGPGPDLTVFENSFLEIGPGPTTEPPFSEPARVSVSQDGVVWHAFPCNLSPDDSPYHPGCAGVYPVLSDGTGDTPHASVPTTEPPIEDLVGHSPFTLPVPEGAGGDSFDLADVGLAWAQYVRLEAADFVDGPAGADNAAFDLDAVAAIHSTPLANPSAQPDCPSMP